MIKLAIFDHDMTVVDSSYAIMEGFNFVARHEGLPLVSHELTMKYIAEGIKKFCEGLLGEYKPEYISLYRSASEECERKYLRLYPDTISTLKELRELGVKTAVVSNREHPSYALKHSGLDKYFDVVVGAEEPYGKLPYKPAPDMIEHLLADLDIDASDAVYVGDADIDVFTAQSSGVRAIGITKGNFSHEDFAQLGAWRSVDNLSEIIGLVRDDALNW